MAAWPRVAVLIGLSAAGVFSLAALRLPAALLLGPMIAAIVLAVSGRPVAIRPPLLFAAQAVVGCMIASLLPPTLFGAIARHAVVFATGIVSVIAAAAALGWLLARFRVLPGTTAVWGAMPGAATVMTLMAESFGADMRLVAFMQYLRVLCVALAATVVARVFGAGPGSAGGVAASGVAAGGASAGGATHWFAVPPPVSLAETIALAVAGAVIGARCRVPAGALLLPMFGGFALRSTGLVVIALPEPLLALSYAVVGWSIGMRFTVPVLQHARRALPRVLLSTATLIGTCGLFAVVLHDWAGVSPLTAYLATSPGGADSVAIISAGAPVDVPFVMAMQVGRFLLVLLIGPSVARLVSRAV